MARLTLTLKQRRFVDAYLVTWSANKAAALAGYGPSAPSKAYKMLRNPLVKAAIEERLKESAMAASEVLTRLTQQAQANPSDFFVFEVKDGKTEMTGINWATVAERGYLIKKLSYDRKGRPVLEFHDPQTALNMLARSKGLLVERQELSGPNGGPLEIQSDVDDVVRRLLSDDAPGGETTPPGAPDEG